MYAIVKRSPRAAKRFNERHESLRECRRELGSMFVEKYGELKFFHFSHSLAGKWVAARLCRDGQRVRVIREAFDERRKDLKDSDFQIHDCIWELGVKWNANLKRPRWRV